MILDIESLTIQEIEWFFLLFSSRPVCWRHDYSI